MGLEEEFICEGNRDELSRLRIAILNLPSWVIKTTKEESDECKYLARINQADSSVVDITVREPYKIRFIELDVLNLTHEVRLIMDEGSHFKGLNFDYGNLKYRVVLD